jgi:hypothetical protein
VVEGRRQVVADLGGGGGGGTTAGLRRPRRLRWWKDGDGRRGGRRRDQQVGEDKTDPTIEIEMSSDGGIDGINRT